MKASNHKTRLLVVCSLLTLLIACGGDGVNSGNGVTVAKAPLSNTGITVGGDSQSGNRTDCTSNILDANGQPVPQDCNHTITAASGSEFDLVKLDVSGNSLDKEAPDWSCVEDKVTGLIWEVKTESGLHNNASTYTWGSTQDNVSSNNCFGYSTGHSGTVCTAQRYVQQVNNAFLCGQCDWRLPTMHELASITNLGGGTGAAIETAYFPNTVSTNYWSATANANSSLNTAWAINFANGAVNNNTAQNTFNRLRLVRGGGS